jgi:CNT family concentrative nucleoside transporter
LIETPFYLRLISCFGLFAFVAIAWLMSSNRRLISWRIVIGGLLLQFAFALIVFVSQRWTFPDAAGIPRFENGILFYGIESVFNQIQFCVTQGAGFLFNMYPQPGDDTAVFPASYVLLRTFAFGILPTVIFFSSLMSVLYYLGMMQWFVRAMAWLMQRTLGTSGAESLAAAANVFVGHTEAPLVIRPFVGAMSRSELNALMVGGFATITGGLMAVYAGMGVSPGHLLTASVISAPAALLIAKLLEPETENPKTLGDVRIKVERQGVNVIEAAAIGASDGMKLALNIGAMLLAFLALIALLNSITTGLGDAVEGMIRYFYTDFPYDLNWSMSNILATLFYPFAWLMGIESGDCSAAGKLLGIKMMVNEFVAYQELSYYISNVDSQGNALPEAEQISERTRLILTYALCGFSNFGAIGIQIGGIGAMAPERRSDLARLGLRAMIGGAIACCMTACIAGIIL